MLKKFNMSGKFLIANMMSALYNKKYFFDTPVVVEYSKICKEILDKMLKGGYIKKYDVVEEGGKKSINVMLRTINGAKVINSIKLFSKPCRRLYMDVLSMKKMMMRNGYSLILLSTSKGVLTISEAIQNNVGGEIICEIF